KKMNHEKGQNVRKKGGFFTKTLQRQILIPFLILLLLVVGVVAVVSYQSSAQNTTDELTKNVENQMAGMDDTFEIFFNNIENTIDRFVFSELLSDYDPENNEEILERLAAMQASDDSIAFIYTGIEETEEMIRSEERRVGKECRCRLWRYAERGKREEGMGECGSSSV